jgi:hypothetical protein
MKKVFRLFVLAITSLVLIGLSIWGPFFRVQKLEISGHKVIGTNSNFLLNFLDEKILEREYFLDGKLSPDGEKIAVISKNSKGKYAKGTVKVVLFDLKSLKRMWETNVDSQGEGFYANLIWNEDGRRILAFNVSKNPQLLDSNSGNIVKEIKEFESCSWFKFKKFVYRSYFKSFCQEKYPVRLVSGSDFSLIWEKNYQEAGKISTKKQNFLTKVIRIQLK